MQGVLGPPSGTHRPMIQGGLLSRLGGAVAGSGRPVSTQNAWWGSAFTQPEGQSLGWGIQVLL